MGRWDRNIYELLGRLSLVDIALGKIDGVSLRRKFGRNPDVDTATLPEDIWNGGGIYTGQPESDVAELVTVVSDSPDDDATAGTGARTVQLEGLGASLATQFETVALNGVTPVDSVNTWRRVPRVRVLTAGSGRASAGTITVAHKATTANVFVQMPVGFNRTAICADTIPASKVGLLLHWMPSSAKGGGVGSAAAITLLTRELGELYETRDFVELDNSAGPTERTLGGIVLQSGADWVTRCLEVSANDTAVSATLLALLFDEDIL